MTPPTSKSPGLVLDVMAAVLAQGRKLHGLSGAMTALALAGAVLPAIVDLPLARPTRLFLGAVVFVGVVELWLAIRVSVDAALFRRLARDPDWTGMDAALMRLDMIPAAKAGRPEAARIAGARRLLRLQAMALSVQLGLAIALAVFGASR